MARLSVPRSRTGCKTCRIRRVKCDEARPSCLACVRTGRKCEGYSTSPTSSHGSNPAHIIPITSYAIPFRVPGSQQDRQLLHYFCVQGAVDVAGFLPVVFWTRTVPLAGHHDPVIRHALIALSSLHLDLTMVNTPSNSPVSDNSSDPAATGTASEKTLARYGNVLRALQRRIDKTVTDNDKKNRAEATKGALICSALFYCFESALGDGQAAVKHLDGGLRLLNSLRDNGADKDDVADSEDEFMDETIQVLGRLDLQATFFNQDRPPLLNVNPMRNDKSTHAAATCGSDAFFPGLAEAQLLLTRLTNCIFRFLLDNSPPDLVNSPVSVDPNVLEEKAWLLNQLDIWEQKFGVLKSLAIQEDNSADTTKLNKSQQRDDSLVRGVQTLLIQHRTFQMLLTSRLPENSEAVFGITPCPDAEFILQLSESLLQRQSESDRRQIFSSETGIVAPLTVIAIRCADESVCTRAMRLLQRSRRREGLYDSGTMVELIRKLEMLQRKKILEDAEAARRKVDVEAEAAAARVKASWSAQPLDHSAQPLNHSAQSLEHAALKKIDPAWRGLDVVGEHMEQLLLADDVGGEGLWECKAGSRKIR
ncbi:hypothetical protein B0H66DRAFT_347936 [Apodospora peruviana]|uniref:Zn(2)-C6 fungal-type domain-containing protein n=1 Tax=Apodospora peruviana TaxID=516989 RepID=A0AAE0HZC8_9PEZI|nr:hypothetical protein B0H66DRAFT_347936 [Apodospora peruviana]